MRIARVVIQRRRMSSISPSSRLEKIRLLMAKEGLSSYLVPSEDPHQSEYTPEQDQRRQFISGFTGSAGTALVGLDKAWLWTDGRYWNQAGKELSSSWQLMKSGNPDCPEPHVFVSKTFPEGSVCGVDPRLLSVSSANNFENALNQSKQTLKYVTKNLVDEVWTDKAAPPVNKVMVVSESKSGRSVEYKINWIRQNLQSKSVDAIVLSALDEIAWMLNIRGLDVPYNPVLISYLIVTTDETHLFVDQSKLSDEEPHRALTHLKQSKVTLHDYNQFFEYLAKLKSESKKFWVDPSSSIAVYNVVKDQSTILSPSPVTLEKALKNSVELDGMKNCNIRDASALVRFFNWLENELKSGNKDISEWQAALKLLDYRKELSGFITPSFATISSTGSNAAIIHYHPNESNSKLISIDNIYLCDSGGQYEDGTTDVTRTWHFGTPTDKEKLAFTAVLKGVISLSALVFPNNVTGLQVCLHAYIHAYIHSDIHTY
eukprot:TRINITY_DN5556_c0_g1_i3.p1 TRINITY_DN5556_c0_g1~~TRINITY_DN5556_c0_g1_i3.p1  ORF type:complete len:487 (+),score=116.01 TRINITY_DN5556_c0_g1_i3:74-1534(+)